MNQKVTIKINTPGKATVNRTQTDSCKKFPPLDLNVLSNFEGGINHFLLAIKQILHIQKH